MLNPRLVINGVEVDILSTSVKLNKQINGLTKFDNRQVDVTDNFILSNTQKNNELFEFINIHSSSGNKQTELLNASLYLSTTEVFKGFCRVVKAILKGNEGYKVRLVSQVQTIKQFLSDKTLKDLNYTSINHTKNSTLIWARMKDIASVGFTYAIFDPYLYEFSDGTRVLQDYSSLSASGQLDYKTLRIQPNLDYLNNTVIDFPEVQPVLYLSWIMDAISTLIDLNFSGDIFTNNDYLKQVITCNKAVIENPRFYYLPNGQANDISYPQVLFENIVHDIDLWTIFSDFLISFGQVFIEQEDGLLFVGINDLVNDYEDWSKYYVSDEEINFDLSNFGQNNKFTYNLNPTTENLLENLGLIDFNKFYDNGYHIEPYEFSSTITNDNLDLNKTIYESKYFNQFNRVFLPDTDLNYIFQTNNPLEVVEYTKRICSERSGQYYFDDLWNALKDQNVTVSDPLELIDYLKMAQKVDSVSAQNSVVEAAIKELYNNLEGNAPLIKYKLSQLNTQLTTINVLNRNTGAFPSNSYQTFQETDDFNFLNPVSIEDTKVNNQEWFEMLNNYKEFTFMLNFDLLAYKSINLTTSKVINGTAYYVSKIEKFQVGKPTKVKMIKIK